MVFIISSNICRHNSQFRLCSNLSCYCCIIISLPSADVMSAKVVTCRYYLRSIRRRSSLSIGLDRRKHCIKKIFPCRWHCVCNYGNKSCDRISLSPKKNNKSVIQVEMRVFFNWFYGTSLNLSGNPIFKHSYSNETISNIPVSKVLAIYPIKVCKYLRCWLYHGWKLPSPWYCLDV